MTQIVIMWSFLCQKIGHSDSGALSYRAPERLLFPLPDSHSPLVLSLDYDPTQGSSVHGSDFLSQP